MEQLWQQQAPKSGQGRDANEEGRLTICGQVGPKAADGEPTTIGSGGAEQLKRMHTRDTARLQDVDKAPQWHRLLSVALHVVCLVWWSLKVDVHVVAACGEHCSTVHATQSCSCLSKMSASQMKASSARQEWESEAVQPWLSAIRRGLLHTLASSSFLLTKLVTRTPFAGTLESSRPRRYRNLPRQPHTSHLKRTFKLIFLPIPTGIVTPSWPPIVCEGHCACFIILFGPPLLQGDVLRASGRLRLRWAEWVAVQRRAVDGLVARTAFQCVRGRCRVSRAVAVCLSLSVRVGPLASCQVRCRRSLASRWYVLACLSDILLSRRTLAHVLLFLFFPRDLSLHKRCGGTREWFRKNHSAYALLW